MEKINTGGGDSLQQNPFANLTSTGLPPGVVHGRIPGPLGVNPPKMEPEKNRGRVDITRETGGRGGKTVTVIDGFVGIGLPEKEQFAKKMRAACGCGGTVKEGRIEIQGDQRETCAEILRAAGSGPSSPEGSFRRI